MLLFASFKLLILLIISNAFLFLILFEKNLKHFLKNLILRKILIGSNTSINVLNIFSKKISGIFSFWEI